ncbi:bifunctional DNA-formamidopyrimidine glycosylase/DNA-(apurinic or apyrimidinic site) lyase [Futiania mangrovi]|uniref:Formamidopyrimidine-DNA glycosylase n=1 Tax=Futiania mangrovi TaxID=2959716 RepID=A0A9J6PK52_9PROT|nr:bifunctional DNA-formamidopyrimidine glycosylase/DNA-(apurinic or apyrimidinic site) lyase [Futiania mangrovii]MCP1336450.1 bifunctional DNA-formamidopyrimidine glycosylase/DNA-(apurinic or apyrimidinic site) lyase [Futiania mangrovii]
MPELPEVETVRMGLAPVMEGRVIARAEQRRPDLRWPFPPRFAERLSGARVLRLGRRAKYLLADLDTGETLIVHLGMSGRMLIHSGGEAAAGRTILGDFHQDTGAEGHAPSPHDHVMLEMEDGTRIVFNDPRRFGSMDLCPTAAVEAHRLLAGLGPEPTGNAFSAAHLGAVLAGKRTPIKAALLDQRIVAGLGNIYVCEALFRARISPRRLAATVPGARAERLAAAIRAVIAEAIAAGGSSLRDYVHTDGELGYFQHSFRVYDREGEACTASGDDGSPCPGTVARIVQSGRSTFFCPVCQR